MALSISATLRTEAVTSSTAKAGAAALVEGKNSECGAVSGLKMAVTRTMLGATCLSNCNHFPAMGGSKLLNPVMLPPGRAKLATKPSPTGSETATNTIGILKVACRSAAKTGVLLATSKSRFRLTNSVA
jgi:hypothetical protein